MRNSRSLAVGFMGALGIVGFLALPASAQQTQAPKELGRPCNLMHDLKPNSDVDPRPARPPTLISFLADPVDQPIDLQTQKKILGSGLPCQETVTGAGEENKNPLENRQRGFDFYSWLTFIALNSPADTNIKIDQSKPTTQTQWENANNFRQLLDVMVEDPDVPANKPVWGEKKIPQECIGQYKPGMMVIEMIEETFNEPFKTGPLIDQQGNYALFDILMNKQMFDFIVSNELYSKKVQMSEEKASLIIDFPSGFNPPIGSTEGGDPGAVMIKVSWRVLDSEKDQQRFHTADALVLMPRRPNANIRPPCLHKTLGLVGFHVVHKTISRRQWIWTSFEHVRNVPEDNDITNATLKPPYNFYDPKCDVETCPVNQTPPPPWDPTYKNGLKFYDRAFRSQITRVIPLTDETKDMNERFQRLLSNTVWKNYMLLSTQWPSDFGCAMRGDPNDQNTPAQNQPTNFNKQPDMTCAPAPTYLANSTLETYSQDSVPLASSSCMDCHGNAVSHQRRPPTMDPKKFFNQSDFTFTLEKAR
jgi:hypothetical protein